MSVAVRMTLLLVGSNVFMTFAWYAHLKTLNDRKWYIAALASWGIALFEYLLQVPANRIGHTQFSVAQLKIIQERSEEHTSELQSQSNLVCRLLLEKKKKKKTKSTKTRKNCRQRKR